MPNPAIRYRRRFEALHSLLTGGRHRGPRDLPTVPRLRRDMGLPEAANRLQPSGFALQAFAFRNRA